MGLLRLSAGSFRRGRFRRVCRICLVSVMRGIFSGRSIIKNTGRTGARPNWGAMRSPGGSVLEVGALSAHPLVLEGFRSLLAEPAFHIQTIRSNGVSPPDFRLV